MKRCHKYHFLYLQLIVRKVMPHVMIKYTNYPGLWLVRAISKTRLSISTCQGLYSKRQTLSLSNYSIDNYGHKSWDTSLKWRPVSVIWKCSCLAPLPLCTMLKLGFETGDWSSTLFGEGTEVVITLVKDLQLQWGLHFLTSHWNVTKCPEVCKWP